MQANTTNSEAEKHIQIFDFPPETDFSKIEILRFMPLERFLAALEFQAIWFSRLGALRDQFECTNPDGPRAFVLRLSDDKEEVERQKKMGMWHLLEHALINNMTGDNGREMHLVNCWYFGGVETHEMWQQFGDNGKGIAIKSSLDRLSDSFQIPNGPLKLLSGIGRVKYVDFRNFSLGGRCPDTAEIAFLKDNAFLGENELRIITPNMAHPGCLDMDGGKMSLSRGMDPNILGLNLKADLKRLIKSVIIGPNQSPYFRMLIKRLVARYDLTVGVDYSHIPPFK